MSFAAAGFLFGLCALAVPWWLHRRDRYDPSRVPVSSVMLMRPAEAPLVRHRRVRQRLLLALRMALLAALAAAFAQPLFERSAAGAAPPMSLPRLIVLDTSLSMTPAFATARRQAAELVETGPGAPGTALILGAGELTLAAPLSNDADTLRRAIAAAQPGASRLDFAGLLGRLAVIGGSVTDAPLDVHIVSDFQDSAMPEDFNALLGGVGDAVARLVLHPVPLAAANWSVTSVRQADALLVTVTGYATPQRSLRLLVDTGTDGDPAIRDVVVPAAGSTTLSLPLPVAATADVGIRVTLQAGDELPADDQTFAVQRVRAPLSLPVVDGGGGGQADFLATAVAAGAPAFQVTAAGGGGPVVVVVDAGALEDAELRSVARHLQQGGGVLMTAGPGTRRAGRLPLPWRALMTDRRPPSLHRVRVVDRGHPVAAAALGWSEVTVSQFVEVAGDHAGAVLLALDDGSPLLVEYPFGAGRVLLLTTALDPQWSTLVTRGAFVGFVADVLRYLARDDLPEQVRVGEASQLPAGNIQVFDAAGRRQLGLGATTGGAALRLAEPGLYTLRTPQGEALLAANPDARESSTRAASADRLARWQQAVRPIAAPPAADEATSQRLWSLAPWLLGAVLLLALVEAVAANVVPNAAAVRAPFSARSGDSAIANGPRGTGG